MAVAHLASSESHTGTVGSLSEASFTWNHTPGGTPQGVTIFVWTNGNTGVSLATGVTYDGVIVPPVTGGEASRVTGAEPGNMKTYHLGTQVPSTNPAAVVVTRTNTTHQMWAVCLTQSANGHTEIYEPGIILLTGSLALVEQTVTDGSSRSASVRYAGGHFAYSAGSPPGPNSTAVESIDIGSTTAGVVVETVPGQGSRPVGMENALAEEKAVVFLAVREVFGVAHLAASESHTGTTGSVSQNSFSWTHAPGGAPRGLLVFVWSKGEFALATGVTYAGVAVPAVGGGEASRTTGEEGNLKAYFLGANIPASDPATIVVTRQNVGNLMWAACVTQSAGENTEIYAPGMRVGAGAGSLVELTVDDGSPGTSSQRYGGGYFAYDTVPAPGANTTALVDFDPGGQTGAVVRETVPGQGARSVGWVEVAGEKAVVYVAVREIITAVAADLSVIVYGYLWPVSPIEPVTPSLVQIVTADVIHVTEGPPSVIRVSPTLVTFQASPDHATVTTYDAVLYTYPGHVVENTISLGKPTPDATNTITADLAPLYAGQPAGDYTVVIVTNAPGGAASSEDSNVFTLPLV